MTGKRQNFYQSDAEREAFNKRLAGLPATDIAWFTGWLCADGSIMVHDNGGPRIRFQITDRDPLLKFADLFGGKVSDAMDPSKWGFGVKPVYLWAITGEKAYHVLKRCRPWMSERYGAKADSILGNWTPRTHRGKKITLDDAMDIKAALAQGTTGRALAHKYGVSEGLISAIKLGRTWSRPDTTGEAA